MLTAIMAPFLAALPAAWVCRRLGRAGGWVLALVPLGVTLWLAAGAPAVWNGETLHASTRWAPALGLDLAFRLDGLSLLFALLISGVGAVVAVYSGRYLAGHPQWGRYGFALLLFMGSMLGVVLADNALLLFVFWELTSITSYLLIGFEHEREDARRGALQALLVTGAGGLALLAGLVALGEMAGTYRLSELAVHREALRSHPHFSAVLALILAGAFTKSAQFPFHFWLPNAMAAPTPASAYLHAATMVKAGVYLLARLTPALAGPGLWEWAVTLTGAVTMLFGAAMALWKTDLKQILAYSTISVLGLLTLLLGIGGDAAWTALAAYVVAHGLYKGALFLTAGAVDHETGVRDIARLGGLRRAMPLTAAAALAAAVSMAGLPPAFGFVGKELVLEAALHHPVGGAALAAAAAATGALLFAAAGLAAVRPFFGPPGNPPKTPHEAPLELWLGPGLLASLGIGLGLFPGALNAAVGSAAAAVAGRPIEPVGLSLFHGLNPALALSAASVAAGGALYAARRRATSAAGAARWGPEAAFDALLGGAFRLAGLQTRVWQSGYLRYYVLTVIAAAVTLTASALTRVPAMAGRWSPGDVHFHEAAVAAFILIALGVVVLSSSPLASVAALGAVGIGMALIFVLFGAPDLAMTQVVVDILMVILFVLVLYHLPKGSQRVPLTGRLAKLAVASAAGGLITVLVMITTAIDHPSTAARYFVENSVPLAGGRNVVNVILVDFRALDTLGEVTVLAVAAVGVYALHRLRTRRGRTP